MKNRAVTDILIYNSQSKFGRILVVTGAKQIGKVTLMKHLFPAYSYINLEDPVIVDSYKLLTTAQWHSLFPNAIINEIQKMPALVESIISVSSQHEENQYILLGSSQILMQKNIKESLAESFIIIELYPLTLPELLTSDWEDEAQLSYFQNIIIGRSQNIDIPFLLDSRHSQKLLIFDNYLQYGGYPAISNNLISDEEKLDWLDNYVRNYLERDISDLAEIRNLETFIRVQKILAENTAQLINFSQIALEAGISSKTAQRFMEYLCISYQTLSLQAWSKNNKKRLVKSPRIHFLDIGVMRSIIQKQGELSIHEFESAVIAEIFKQTKTLKFEASFYHLRTSDGREIDLLIETEKGYIAFKIKMATKIREADARHFRGLEDILDKPILACFLISNDLNRYDFGDGIIAISAVEFLS